MSSLHALFHCMALDVHNNFFRGVPQRRYKLDASVFHFLRGRIQHIRAMYHQLIFSTPAMRICHWEALMTDQMFFGLADPIGMIEGEYLYLEGFRGHLYGLSAVAGAQREAQQIFTTPQTGDM